jgi:hypothetical protein
MWRIPLVYNLPESVFRSRHKLLYFYLEYSSVGIQKYLRLQPGEGP